MTDLKRMKALYDSAGPEARRELMILMWVENRIEDWQTTPSEIITILRRHYEGDREANLCRIAALPQRRDELPSPRKCPEITPLTDEDGDAYRRYCQSRTQR